MARDPIFTQAAPAAIGPYSQAIMAGEFLFCSGQIGMDPQTGELVGGGTAAQTRRALDNLGAVLNAAGLGLENVLKTTVFLSRLSEFSEMNRVYAEYFQASPPARSTIEAGGLPKGAAVEIEAIAWRG